MPAASYDNGYDPSAKEWIRPNPAYMIPDITLHDPANKKIRAICIGAGMSGIAMAYKIQEFTENIELQVYERNDGIGGTWFENR